MSVDAGLMERANRNYNLFQVYDNNPIYQAFSLKYPSGTADMQLSVEYDHLGQQHSGIKIKCGTELELAWQEPFNTFVVREIFIYKRGAFAPKYGQKVFLNYKKKVKWEHLVCYSPQVEDENVEWVMLQILDWWEGDSQ